MLVIITICIVQSTNYISIDNIENDYELYIVKL